jgi:hypothetical protein
MLVLYILHEQIHWSLLMTGFFLADEPPALPYPANHYVATSDLATAIAAQVLTFFDSVADESNDKWSPQVVETLYWWFERWGYTYLFVPDKDNGNSIGVPGGGDWKGIATWGIARMRKDVEGWAAEKEIISQVPQFYHRTNKDNYYAQDFFTSRKSATWTINLWYVLKVLYSDEKTCQVSFSILFLISRTFRKLHIRTSLLKLC